MGGSFDSFKEARLHCKSSRNEILDRSPTCFIKCKARLFVRGDQQRSISSETHTRQLWRTDYFLHFLSISLSLPLNSTLYVGCTRRKTRLQSHSPMPKKDYREPTRRNSRRDRGDLKASAGYGANRPPHDLVTGPRLTRTTMPPEARASTRPTQSPSSRPCWPGWINWSRSYAALRARMRNGIRLKASNTPRLNSMASIASILKPQDRRYDWRSGYGPRQTI